MALNQSYLEIQVRLPSHKLYFHSGEMAFFLNKEKSHREILIDPSNALAKFFYTIRQKSNFENETFLRLRDVQGVPTAPLEILKRFHNNHEALFVLDMNFNSSAISYKISLFKDSKATIIILNGASEYFNSWLYTKGCHSNRRLK